MIRRGGPARGRPGQEGAEHGPGAERRAAGGREQAESEHVGEHGSGTPRALRERVEHREVQAAPEAEHDGRETERQEKPRRNREHALGRGQHQRHDQAEEDPAHQVAEQRGRHHDHPEVAAIEIQLHQRARDHGQRRDREAGAQEEREVERLGPALPADRRRVEDARPEAQREGDRDPRDRDRERHPPLPGHTVQLDLDSGADQEDQQREPREEIQGLGARTLPREERGPAGQRQRAETGRPEQHSGEQLSQQRRQRELHGQSAEQARAHDDQQHREQEPRDLAGIPEQHRATR